MHLYIINLDRRPDRFCAMAAQLMALGVRGTRVSALDAMQTPKTQLQRRFRRGPLGDISSGDMACTLSHLRALRQFLRTDDSHAVICEDDILFSGDAGRFLSDAGWIPAGIDLVKLERFGPDHQHIVAADWRDAGGRKLGRLLSKHCGGGAYIVSRRTARMVLDWSEDRIFLPIDHLLFNPNNSPLFHELEPWQLAPAVARQRDMADSDIDRTRKQECPDGIRYAWREMLRGYYEARRLPAQMRELLAQRATFTPMSFL
jgi:glycosyl transferase family 25